MCFNIAMYKGDYEAEEEERSVVSDGHFCCVIATSIFYLFLWICREVNDGEVVLDILRKYLGLDEKDEVTSCLSTVTCHQTCMVNRFYMNGHRYRSDILTIYKVSIKLYRFSSSSVSID